MHAFTIARMRVNKLSLNFVQRWVVGVGGGWLGWNAKENWNEVLWYNIIIYMSFREVVPWYLIMMIWAARMPLQNTMFKLISKSLFPALGHHSVVAEYHNIWKFTEKLFMTKGCHSLLWPKVTTFVNPQGNNKWVILTQCHQRKAVECCCCCCHGHCRRFSCCCCCCCYYSNCFMLPIWDLIILTP